VPSEAVGVARTGRQPAAAAEGAGRQRRHRLPSAPPSGPRRQTRGPASGCRARIRAAAGP